MLLLERDDIIAHARDGQRLERELPSAAGKHKLVIEYIVPLEKFSELPEGVQFDLRWLPAAPPEGSRC